MGKVLRALVVLIAILGIVALIFASKNYAKREALAGRAHALEEAVIRLAGTFEAADLPDMPAPAYPARDISPVTSRELENPERSAFWDSYVAKLEAVGDPPPMLSFGTSAMRLQLRQFYQVGPDGKYVIDPLTGGPATEGEGTMDELLKRAQDRAKAQYNVLLATRSELTKTRTELVDTIEDLNRQKKEGRDDKREIDNLNAEVSRLTTNLRQKEQELETANENLEEARSQIEELNDTVAEQGEQISELEGKVEEQDQIIRELKGAAGLQIVQTADIALQEGVLTPGDKGKIVDCNDEWKYAIIAFSPEFITELVGADRSRALPAIEVMVRRPGIEDIDSAFVTRLKLRQIIRDKNIVIADVLPDWQQKGVQVGDIVFY